MRKTIIFVIFVIPFVIFCIFTSTKVFSKEKTQNELKTISIDDKLKDLGYLNNKASYFRQEYLDRYISYKKKNKTLSNYDIILRVNIGLDQDWYTNIKKSPNIDTNQVLVNKFYYLDEQYIPKNLVKISTDFSSSDKYLVNVAQISFEYLAKKAKDEGYTIRAVSAYRSYNYQTNLYNNYVKTDGVKNADQYSARPGFSEHQTGLAVDVDNKITNFNDFENTKEFSWMQENAHKYGFILRYPKGKENITGYIYEPWHYRYVGIEIASFIHKNNITYEEYYFKYLDK